MKAQVTLEKRNGLSGFGHTFMTGLKSKIGILIGLAALCVVLAILTDSFATSRNILSVLRQMSTNVFLACGMTMVIILGCIDLSVFRYCGVGLPVRRLYHQQRHGFDCGDTPCNGLRDADRRV